MEFLHTDTFPRYPSSIRFPPIQYSSYTSTLKVEKRKNISSNGKIRNNFESELLTPIKYKFPTSHSAETKRIRFLKEVDTAGNLTKKSNFLNLVAFYQNKVMKWRKNNLKISSSSNLIKPIPLKRMAPALSNNPNKKRKRDDPLNIEDEEDLFYQDLRKSNKRINQGNGIYAIRNTNTNIFSNMKDSNYKNQILLSKNRKNSSKIKNEYRKLDNKKTKKMKFDEYRKKIYSNSDETNDEDDNIFMFETPPIKKKANVMKGSLMEKQIKNLKKALKNYMNRNLENNKLTIVLDLQQPEKIEINGETLERNKISLIKEIVHSVQKPEDNIFFNEKNVSSHTETCNDKINYDSKPSEHCLISENQSKSVSSLVGLVEKIEQKTNQNENNSIPSETKEMQQDFNATNFEKLSTLSKKNENNDLLEQKIDKPEITNAIQMNSAGKNISQPEKTQNALNENTFNPFLMPTASMPFNLNSFITSNINNLSCLTPFNQESNNICEQNTFTNMNENLPIVQESNANIWKNEPVMANNFFFNQPQQEYPCNPYNNNYFASSNNEMIFENNNPRVSEPNLDYRNLPLMNNNSLLNSNNNNNTSNNGMNNLCNFFESNYKNINNPFSIINDGRYDINEQIKTNFVNEHKDAGNLFSVKNQNNSAQPKLSSYMSKKTKTQKLRINDL